jgi:Holliday junction resolvase RusA-like endonuclease
MNHQNLKDYGEIVFVLPGEPIPLARARHGRQKVYDSQSQMKLVSGLQLQKQLSDRPQYCGPLHLIVNFYMKMPDGQRKKWDLFRGRHHVYKPDLSNLVKYCEDVANAVLYRDDCIISKISATKIYDIEPRTEFILLELK